MIMGNLLLRLFQFDGEASPRRLTENKELEGSFLFLEMNADEISCGD